MRAYLVVNCYRFLVICLGPSHFDSMGFLADSEFRGNFRLFSKSSLINHKFITVSFHNISHMIHVRYDLAFVKLRMHPSQ